MLTATCILNKFPIMLQPIKFIKGLPFIYMYTCIMCLQHFTPYASTANNMATPNNVSAISCPAITLTYNKIQGCCLQALVTPAPKIQYFP